MEDEVRQKLAAATNIPRKRRRSPDIEYIGVRLSVGDDSDGECASFVPTCAESDSRVVQVVGSLQF
jgi:hypothetical protein